MSWVRSTGWCCQPVLEVREFTEAKRWWSKMSWTNHRSLFGDINQSLLTSQGSAEEGGSNLTSILLHSKHGALHYIRCVNSLDSEETCYLQSQLGCCWLPVLVPTSSSPVASFTHQHSVRWHWTGLNVPSGRHSGTWPPEKTARYLAILHGEPR